MEQAYTMNELTTNKPAHLWLQHINIAFIPGQMTPMLESFVQGLSRHLEKRGHTVQDMPDNRTDVILTTAPFGESRGWRKSLLFTARFKYKLENSPTIFTLVQITPQQFNDLQEHFRKALAKEILDPDDFAFDGLNSEAYKTLAEQGRRGGTILTLVRIVQSQSKSIRVILVVGDDQPVEAYTFDLVGAHPKTDASDLEGFYEDLSFRIVTAVSTHEITEHEVVDDIIDQDQWKKSDIPAAMKVAGLQLGKRDFFTEMVRISDLVEVPAINDAVSSQYSEGCYATWDPSLNGLVATITGSARPVDKDNLTDDELAVIVGVRPDGKGALIRHVEGKRNDSPSSEAVELMDMDSVLPQIQIGLDEGYLQGVPVARSKLHGHRGVKVYDPRFIEHVFLSEPYYHYPVSCSTEAQARAIKAAFSSSEALLNPDDPRQVIFTILPGHGIVIVEKWVPGKAPFQVIWEYMDEGLLQIDNLVPQGAITFVQDGSGLMNVKFSMMKF
jgi:hypothetical protein